MRCERDWRRGASTRRQRTEEEGERAARWEEGEFLDKPTKLLRDGGDGGAHLRMSSRDGAKVAGWGGIGAAGSVMVTRSVGAVSGG